KAAPAAPAVAVDPEIAALGYARPELLVSTGWLAQRVDDPTLRIVDVRPADKYAAGHLPNAISIPSGILNVTVGKLTNELPPKDKLEEMLGAVGIGDDARIVLYDDQRSLSAARAYFVLDYYGHKNISILNGGNPKWEKENRDVTRQAPKLTPVKYTATADSSKLATREYILANLKNLSVGVCDTRTPNEYAGTDVRAARGGHIPDSKNVNWETAMSSADPGAVFKPAAEIAKLYDAQGLTKDKEIITLCQSGVRAAHGYFTHQLLGYTKVRNYDGSWEDWGNDQTTPIEKPAA
ncbi:MAG: sulfurtransferase, partial [Chloroflexota bacterium]